MFLQRLTDFFQTLGKNKDEFDQDDPRVAAVALLFYIAYADGVEQSVEKETLKNIVSREYELCGEDLKKLIDAGRNAHQSCLDPLEFSSILKRHLTPQQCTAFIGLLWEIAYADGYVYELEDTLIWRVADLIGVNRDDRLELKKQIEEKYKRSQNNE